MAEINVNEEIKEKLNFKIELINKKHQSGALIPLLQSAQNSYGFIPEKNNLLHKRACKCAGSGNLWYNYFLFTVQAKTCWKKFNQNLRGYGMPCQRSQDGPFNSAG